MTFCIIIYHFYQLSYFHFYIHAWYISYSKVMDLLTRFSMAWWCILIFSYFDVHDFMLSMLGKTSADDSLKLFSYFSLLGRQFAILKCQSLRKISQFVIYWISHDISVISLITKTYLYNVDPLKPHFFIVKLGFTGVYIIFLIFAQNMDCAYLLEPPHQGSSNKYLQSMFWAKIWKI